MSDYLDKIDALLFDLDGTLIDTAEDFVFVLNNLRAKHKLEPLEPEAIKNTVSDGARALVQLAFGGREGEPLFDEHRKDLLDQYMEIVGEHAKLFKGMPEVLDRCESLQIPWGIITNKPRRFTEKLLSKLDLTSKCALLICADDVSQAKPHPESMYIAANKLQVNLENSVYVGDHERDIVAGNSAKMITVIAKYGYISKDTDFAEWNATHIIEHPEQLKQLFLS